MTVWNTIFDIIHCAYESTLLELDPLLMYQESCYQNAMLYFMRQLINDTQISSEVTIPYRLSNGFVIGHGRADIIIETSDEVHIIELKRGLCKICNARSQTRRYMSHFQTRKPIRGTLVVFNLDPFCEEIFI